MQFQCFPINSRRKTTFIRCLLRKFPVIDYQTLDRIRTTFTLSVTRFRCSPINAGHSAPLHLWRFPTGVSCHQSPGTWLVTDFFHSFPKIIPVFMDYCRISTVEIAFMPSLKDPPHPSSCYYTVTTSYNTFPYLWKVWPSRGYSHSRLRTPLLGHMGGISLL